MLGFPEDASGVLVTGTSLANFIAAPTASSLSWWWATHPGRRTLGQTCRAASARIGGKLAIRIALINHRTRSEDLHLLLDALLRMADQRLAHESI
jgi:hypothetical protein